MLGTGIRSEFPIFEHTTYLNSCSQGALSHRVRRAYDEYLAGWDERGPTGSSGSSARSRRGRGSPAC